MRIDRKPGESFDLELTVWNYYRHPIRGTVEPRLPEGWRTSSRSGQYRLEPGGRLRTLFQVTIPRDSRPGVSDVGGYATYRGARVEEIQTSRVRVAGDE
jgi:hypothetical protein